MSLVCSLISNRISMATNSQLNSVAFPETRAVGEEGVVVVVVGVTGGVAEIMVETAEAVDGEGADHPEIVECHHPVIEEAVTMTVTVTTTVVVVVDTVVLLRPVVALEDFILVQIAMGSILLPLMVLMGVLMDLLLLVGLVDLAPLLLVEVVVVTVDLVHLARLEQAYSNLLILYLLRALRQTVALVVLDQMAVVPLDHLVPLPGAWALLLQEKDILVVPHLLAPLLHLGVIWAMDDDLQIWGDLHLRETVPATIEEVFQAVVSL